MSSKNWKKGEKRRIEKRELEFEVIGKPVAKGRPRKGKWGVYTPKKTKDFEELVKASYFQKYNLHDKLVADDLRIVVKAIFEPTKAEKSNKKKYVSMVENKTYYHKKPDGDNVLKAVCDALNGIAYIDDSRIVEHKIVKLYGEEAKTIVKIREL